MCFKSKPKNTPIRRNFQLCDGIRCHTDTNVFVESEKDLKRMQNKQARTGSKWFWQRVD